jgi:tRNA1Val (adenine37-N6)-methyltransferase
MPNTYFQFKQFTIHQDHCAMKVTTDSCLFGAWAGNDVRSRKSEDRSILDIGAGTGLLSLMLAQQINASITAIEIDKDAFEQASENIAASPWKDNINIIHTDIKDFVAKEQYDCIISNPPFYENEWQSGDAQKNIAHHSHQLLLDDLPDIIRNLLKPGGTFYLLLPYKRHTEIMKLFSQKNIFIVKKILIRQTEEHDYFRFIIKAQFEAPGETFTEEISIRDTKNDYTKAFTTLLKDYYLYL